jgi:lipopolysaccharide transport system ATP-binding protein
MSSLTSDLRSPTSSSQGDAEVLVKVENVSKIFCRDLKKSLLYGLQDSARDLFSWQKGRDRPPGGPTFPSSAGGSPTSSKSTIQNQQSSIVNQSSNSRSLRPGEFLAVDNVSFDLRRGECLGLIGHNGAGKTTLLKMLNGLIKPDAGRIEMRGRVGALIALGAGFNPILSGRENIYVNGSILGLTKAEIDTKIDDIIDFAEIGEFIDAPVQNYSSGMQVRLGFAVASALQPSILLLDEVLAVGDVAFQAKCFNKLADLRREGVPFILVSHNMHQISRYCQKVVFMKKGSIAFVGDAEEGIGLFLADMKEPGQDQSPGPDWSVVHGSGKVVFTAAEFLDAEGNPVDSVGTGNRVTLSVSFKRHHEPVIDPVFDVVVRCRGEMVFQSTNRNNSIQLGLLPAEGKLILQFGSIPMNIGPLDFYFCLLDGISSELFDWKRDLRLEVKPDPSQSGTLYLNTEWSVIAS